MLLDRRGFKGTGKRMKKTYLQCGYEDKCKKKDCLNCPRKIKGIITLTQAEMIVIEDFAVCDLDSMKKYHLRERNLMQDIMRKVMKKTFKVEKNES